jgi:four helix bundle protein
MNQRISNSSNYVKDHRDLKVWKLAVDLATAIYELTKHLPAEERYGLSIQLQRAAVSIASNIAEGAARGSRKDFIRFLRIATGSASELETQLIILGRIGHLQKDMKLSLHLEQVRKITNMIHGLIRALK